MPVATSKRLNLKIGIFSNTSSYKDASTLFIKHNNRLTRNRLYCETIINFRYPRQEILS